MEEMCAKGGAVKRHDVAVAIRWRNLRQIKTHMIRRRKSGMRSNKPLKAFTFIQIPMAVNWWRAIPKRQASAQIMSFSETDQKTF